MTQYPDVVGDTDLAALWQLSPRFDLTTAIGEHMCRALVRRLDPSTVACFDNWSAKIAVDFIATGPTLPDAAVAVAGPSDELIARAERRRVPLADVADGPAAVVILPWLPTATAALVPELWAVLQTCGASSTLVWSQSLRWPDRVGTTRSVFARHGFHEIGTDQVGVAGPGLPGWFVASETRDPQPHRGDGT